MKKRTLLNIYDKTHRHFGPRHWWPAETQFEVIIGAILTQNTAWKNVEKAISNLKDKGLLRPEPLHKVKPAILGALIRPAGYYNIKTKRLKNFVNFLFLRYTYNLKAMFSRPLPELRRELLEVNGIGPETADSILLYAGGKPTFVVDAYTKRIFSRHGLVREDIDYHRLQGLFMDNLPRKASLFNEYHALIVEAGKTFCKRKPLCGQCPLKELRR